MDQLKLENVDKCVNDWFVFMLQSSFLIQCQVGSHTTSAMVPTEWTESQSSQTGGLTFLVLSRAAGPGKIRLQNANEFSQFLKDGSHIHVQGAMQQRAASC